MTSLAIIVLAITVLMDAFTIYWLEKRVRKLEEKADHVHPWR